MVKKLKMKVIGLSIFSLMSLSVAQFNAPTNVYAASIPNNDNSNVQSIITSIKADKASNASEINKLFDYAKTGNKKAIEQLKSFDCFNKKVISQYAKKVVLAPNTSKTIVFDDGSRIVYQNRTSPVNVSTNAAILSNFGLITPMDSHVTNCTASVYVGSRYIGYEGGSAYWYDISRDSCHIISTSPSIAGPLITISSTSSQILENDITDSTYQVNAQFTGILNGQVIYSVVGDDIIFVDTGGISGFEYDGLK